MLNCPVYWCSNLRSDVLLLPPRPAAAPVPGGPGGAGGAPLAAPEAVAVADPPDPDADSLPDLGVAFLELLAPPPVDVDDVLP